MAIKYLQRCSICGKRPCYSKECKEKKRLKMQELIGKKDSILNDIAEMCPDSWISIIHKISEKYSVSTIGIGRFLKPLASNFFYFYPYYSQQYCTTYKNPMEREKAIEIYNNNISQLPGFVKNKILHNKRKEEIISPLIIEKWKKCQPVNEIANELNMKRYNVKRIISKYDYKGDSGR